MGTNSHQATPGHPARRDSPGTDRPDNQHMALSRHLADLTAQEIAHALRLPRTGVHMRLLEPIVRRLSHRFAELAAAFNADIAALGFREAAGRFVAHFAERLTASGTEVVPPTGPLVVASNHPGATDAFSIIASLPRDDTALVISDVPITRALPATRGHFIYVSGEMDSHVNAVREMTSHLQNGGAVVIFPSANLTPDPMIGLPTGRAGGRSSAAHDALAEATFGHWSPSILLPLRRVPDCRIQPAIVSGVLHPRYAHHPLARYIPDSRPWERQLLGEVLQVMRQIRSGDRMGVQPHVRFGTPVAPDELSGLGREVAMAKIIERAVPLLHASMP
ncbi:MAG: hypothetical protein MUF84_13635 [Anaerolineae bacterium]|nr:hypothetical protein [Anaerolineae bacterium]